MICLFKIPQKYIINDIDVIIEKIGLEMYFYLNQLYKYKNAFNYDFILKVWLF